jgi:uncharacterized protein YaaW (UPF0174 family)
MNDIKRVPFRLKHGDSELETEVPEDQVQAMYAQFLEKIGSDTKQPAGVNPDHADGGTAIDETQLGRIFEVKPSGIVTLRRPPKGENQEADALLLIIYGFRKIKQQEEVLATNLLAAAEYLGLKSYRPAHALAGYLDQYVIRGGLKKGSWYGLTTQGVLKAEEVLSKMFV